MLLYISAHPAVSCPCTVCTGSAVLPTVRPADQPLHYTAHFLHVSPLHDLISHLGLESRRYSGVMNANSGADLSPSCGGALLWLFLLQFFAESKVTLISSGFWDGSLAGSLQELHEVPERWGAESWDILSENGGVSSRLSLRSWADSDPSWLRPNSLACAPACRWKPFISDSLIQSGSGRSAACLPS